MSDDFDHHWDDDDDRIEWAEWLVCNVLQKTGSMPVHQWCIVASCYSSLFDDDPACLREKAPNMSKLCAMDIAYFMYQYVRHLQHTLTDEDKKRLMSAGQLRQMRLKRTSLK